MNKNLAAGLMRTAALLALGAGLALVPAQADDIDIYAGATSSGAGEPIIVFLIDNSPNWGKNDQKITDLNGNAVASGVAEVQAIQDVLAAQKSALKVGIAMLTNSSRTSANGGSIQSGAYMRFGVRDMTNNPATSPNFQALSAILGWYVSGNNITNSAEKLGSQSDKNESAAFYELYKYFHGTAPYAGALSPTGQSQPSNQFADVSGNNNSGVIGGYTAYGKGLTADFAIQNGLYQSQLATYNCAKAYIIYIANNANYNFQTGVQTFETGTSAVSALPAHVDDSWADEWAATNLQAGVTTYVLDAFNNNQDVNYSSSLLAIAKAGGGAYYQVKKQQDIETALAKVLAEIQSVNSTFASASLPVNTTNRTQDLNQVFIGSFRPDPDSLPRWKGNLKEYQVISNSGILDLGDSLGNPALSATTGYVGDCAVSYWTTDTSSVSPPTTPEAYWLHVPDSTAQNSQQPVTKTQCATPPTPTVPPLPSGLTTPDPYSDWPDGPAVEKGGVAEVLRKGNNPPGTQTSPTFQVNRTVLTQSGNTLKAFNPSASQLSAAVTTWVLGADSDVSTTSPGPEKPGNASASPYNTRPSIHGDVIHSRPQPINYGGTLGTVVYYGSNDGMYRAVNATTGAEMWSFIAPEFLLPANSLNNYSKFQRLYDNSPQVKNPNLPTSITPAPTYKDYFFDGNTGVFQNADNSMVYIYLSMRRGGRMFYALDVTAPASPQYLWKFGCPDMSDDSGCTSGSSAIGQTWSQPTVAFVKGYSATSPVVIVGGGYDTCEDANTQSPSCSSPKGAIVYVLDASNGNVIQSFTGTRSFVADPALATVHTDGSADYAYFSDTGGSVYRLDFVDGSGAALDKNHWVFHKVAYTSGGGRKFLFAPATLPTTTSGGVPQASYVALGSGDREHPLIGQYPYTTPITNRFYVFLDDLTTSSRAAVNLDDTNTADSYYMGDYTNNNCTTTAACTALQLVPNSSATTPLQVGWFINLAAGTGEQTVTSSLIAAGAVAFSTNRPIPPAQSTCNNTLGEARGYNLSLFNASGNLTNSDRSGVFLGGGLPASPTLFTTTVGTQVVTGTIGVKTDTCNSAECPSRPPLPVNPKRRVLYWHLSGDNK